jgi:hypothetical protein
LQQRFALLAGTTLRAVVTCRNNTLAPSIPNKLLQQPEVTIQQQPELLASDDNSSIPLSFEATFFLWSGMTVLQPHEDKEDQDAWVTDSRSNASADETGAVR